MAYDLIQYNVGRSFFRTCMKNPRKCIVKHNIPKQEYVFAIRKNNNQFMIYDASFKKANLYLSSEYVKKNVVSKMKQPSVSKNEKNVFLSKCVSPFSCIYLFSLGSTKDLRDHIKLTSSSSIDGSFCKENNEHDDAIVCKFGMTNNLQRRTLEHHKTFGKISNVNMELEICAHINPQFLYEAESKLYNYFKLVNYVVPDDGYKELIVIPKKHMKMIKALYQDVSELYHLSESELIHKIKELELEKELLVKERQLQDEKHSNFILKEKIERFYCDDKNNNNT